MPPAAPLRPGGTRPGRSHGITSAIVASGRLQEISLRPVHAEAPARLPHPGERPDPAAAAAAAALPDLRGGVAKERFPRKRLLARNHAAVPKNGEAVAPGNGEELFQRWSFTRFLSPNSHITRWRSV